VSWVVWDPNSRLPLAMRFATIEVADINLAREVVEQALANLGAHAEIASLAVDRGFLDGAFLWWLNKKGIIFHIPAKTDMHVYRDALSLVDKGIRQTKEKKRSVGKGKNKTTIIDRWDVVGIESLTSAGFYGELGSGSHENRKDFFANPINAVVVLHDPYKENNPNSHTMVILTNGPVKKPLRVYEGYDARSEIENGLFREAKQGWFIERPARNNADAFRSHVYLTLITMALTTVFRTWMDQQDEREKQGEETGIRKFREKVKQENGNKLILFDENRYAIFDTYEVFILCDRNVRKPTGVPEVVSKQDILEKYGALRE
ncbi:MAG: transposase, partial [Desulfobacteraceae bacterium]|nr:transposase [Desulfobacteraceae bacterium]